MGNRKYIEHVTPPTIGRPGPGNPSLGDVRSLARWHEECLPLWACGPGNRVPPWPFGMNRLKRVLEREELSGGEEGVGNLRLLDPQGLCFEVGVQRRLSFDPANTVCPAAVTCRSFELSDTLQ